MSDYRSLHDFQHVYAFVLIKFGLFWISCCWVCSIFLTVLGVIHFFLCLIHFAQVLLIFFLMFLGVLFFFVFGFFLGCFRVKLGFLARFMVKPKISGQPSRVNLIESSKKKWVKGFNTLFGLP